MMDKKGNQLDVFYIDFCRDMPKEDKKKSIGSHILKDLFIPGYIFYDAYNGATKYSQAQVMGKILSISSEEELSHFINPLGNKWIIHTNPSEMIGQYYVRHPKTSQSNLLIEANLFNKYIYDEYCTELINYCCSHCPAKSIIITSVVTHRGGIGAGAKKINIEVIAESKVNEVFCLKSETELIHQDPLPKYLWLEKSIMHSISSMPKNCALDKATYCDFSFNMSADILRFIGADMNFAQTYKFTIRIES